jgi:cation transport regulator ChaC
MKKLKQNRGGTRQGSGAKLKYGEPTVNCTFRIPVSKKAEVREMVYDYLNSLID